ncbi:ATP7 [[Candida] subhashii]|uniref:ATP synthase subunit d, mitochondrial n=1 Tax=[Candida] subhashii TaxID=561895 RepID=A0A8J5UG78_9ASCO|nr:ATP7 [[Candida] subhashii]KAG7662343.1 ATP7 [[Candida] subhashii]
MSAVAKQVAKKVDFTKVINSLGLSGTTAGSLSAFKKRHDEAKKENLDLSAHSIDIDFNHYRSVLKNSKVVDQIERSVKSFTPVTIDVSKNLKNIEIFEQKAIENAQLTEKSVLAEISQLQQTLKDIETARPFDELTVDDVIAAKPIIEERLTWMVKNGKWEVPGYKEKFGDLAPM